MVEQGVSSAYGHSTPSDEMVLLVHAFSRRNAGDGMLVDLAADRLVRLGVPRSTIRVIALDPGSFEGEYAVYAAPGDPEKKLSLKVLDSVRQWVSRGFGPQEGMSSLVDAARAVVGVGGGYLRSDGLVTGTGAFINHGHALAAVAQSMTPSIYLPQSIGPLRGPMGRQLGQWLSGVDIVCARDELSVSDLAPYVSSVRIPDMAILALAETWDDIPSPTPSSEVLLVPRRLNPARTYNKAMMDLGRALPNAHWAVQAAVNGPKDDAKFIEGLGFKPEGRLGDLLDTSSGGVVVSVRLHGALQALLRGFPAIHLSYERKGWAAYQDLGLTEYVHDARSFDPSLVLSQVASLQQEPIRQWDAVSAALPDLLGASERLSTLVSDVVGVPRVT